MANVYGYVKEYYNECIEAEHILPMDIVEKYLRMNAWKGTSEDELFKIWDAIHSLMDYTVDLQLQSLLLFSVYDFQEIGWRFVETLNDEGTIDDAIISYLNRIEDFFRYLQKINYMSLLELFLEAKATFFSHGKFSLPSREEIEKYRSVFHPMLDEYIDDFDENDEVQNEFLLKVEEYFHDAQFMMDISHAMMLFGAPNFEEIMAASGEEQQTYWSAFWDYFLFSYHLMKSDIVPFKYYVEHEGKNLTPKEAAIANDLLEVEFSLFSIDGFEEDGMICRDMFTNEIVARPMFDVLPAESKKLLFFGYAVPSNIMLMNHITSIPASEKLRKRIQEEIFRQYEVFKYQMPDATMEDFVRRETAVIYRIICILTVFAKLKAVPMLNYPEPIEQAAGIIEEFSIARERLQERAKNVGFSHYAIELITKLYGDFLSVSAMPDEIKRKDCTLAAVLLVFAEINGMEIKNIETLFEIVAAEQEKIYQMVDEIRKSVKYIKFDPRYMTEDGFIFSICLE